jgi:Holliday junction resolvase RusA-like endonuclease
METSRPYQTVMATAAGDMSLHVVFSCWVPGQPQTKGSARGFGFKRGDGSIGVNITNDNPKAKEWQHRIAFFAKQALGNAPPSASPFGVRAVFYFERPAGHVLTRKTVEGSVSRLSATGRKRLHHTTKPDIDKALRVVLDALTGVLYVDDCQVVDTLVAKKYVMPGLSGSGVMIEAVDYSQAERWMPETQL